MDYTHLEYIVVLAEEKNVSRAAEKLLITQSALSQYLLNLEKCLGVPLFNRVRNIMALTYAGEVYLTAAREILFVRKNTTRMIEDIMEFKKGDISFGVGLERGIYLLPDLYPAFCSKYPGVTLNVVQNYVRQLETMTLQGYIDISLLSLYNRATDLDYTVLCQEEMLLAVPRSHPMASLADSVQHGKRPTIDLHLFRNESFVVTKPGYETRQIVDAMFQDAGIVPNIVFESDSNFTVYDTAANIPALCFVPETIIRTTDPFSHNVYFSINPLKYSWKMIAAYRKGTYLNRATTEFIDLLRTILRRSVSTDHQSDRLAPQACISLSEENR